MCPLSECHYGMKGSDEVTNLKVKSLIESIACGLGNQVKSESKIFQTCFGTDLYQRIFNYRH